MELPEKYKNFRTGYVTIIGRPNSGKSTLMNAVLREKISIVTAKPQTTRQNVLGILTGADYQMVFTDTPGLLTPKYKLQEAMLQSAVRAIKEADLIFYLVEADGNYKEKDVAVFKQLELDPRLVFLLINKVDLVEKDAVLPLIQFYHTRLQVSEIFPISALNQTGLPEVIQSAVGRLPLNPPFFPEDELSTFPERFFVAEIIREKIFLNFEQEIPYSTTVHIEEFKERGQGKDYIRAAIYIERAAQRKILIGKNGQALKKIGQLARTEIEVFLQRPVFLELYVAVREKWRQNERLLKEFGYLS